MTVMSPRRSARPRGTRALVTVLVAAALTLTAALPAVAGPPATAPSAPAPGPTVPPGTTALTVAPAANGVVRPGDGLTVSVLRQNATASTLPAGEITLAIADTPLADRAALTRWLGGDTAGVTTRPVATTGIDAVEPRSETTEGIVVDAGDPALADRAPGVYPLTATIDAGGDPESANSVMIVPDDGATAGLGTIVPITAGPLETALLSEEQLEELTAPGGALTTQLDALDGTDAILAIDPAIPAAIRALGTAAPASATAWLDRLTALPHSRFALQFGDADPAVQIDAGLSRPLRPLPLTAALDPADFVPVAPTPGASPTPTPSPTATPPADDGAVVLPELDELLAVDAARTDVYWPAPATTGAAAVAALGALGTAEEPTLTVLPSTSLVAGADGRSVPARATIGDAGVLAYDADASRALSAASVLDSPALRGSELAAATAYLAFATADLAGGTVLVALDRSVEQSRVGLRAAITAAQGAPGATPQRLDAVIASTATAAEIVDVPLDDVRVAGASALIADEEELARFATILDEPTLLTGPERAEILQLLGVAWTQVPAQAEVAVAQHRLQTRETLDAVALQPTSTINLLGSEARLWFTVRNDLPYPVNLVLYASPDDLRLNVQRANPFVATPESNTRIEVPVQARLGNGEVTLDLQLRSRASVAIGDPQSVEVNVRAEWETTGLVALGVVVGGLLIMGVVRTVRKLRARRAPTADADEGPAP